MIDRNFTKALPVLFGFFVMGFCDVVGIATSYIKNDFSLSETVAGFILLMKMNDVAYFRANIILVLVGATGFFCSSIFSIIYSQAMKARPNKTNEISGLMIMGVCGGAVIPPLMGMLADAVGNQNGSVMVIGACLCYLAAASFILGKGQAARR